MPLPSTESLSSESLSITHSSTVFLCPSFPASQGSDLPSAGFLVKPLSRSCSFHLIAHSPLHSPCSSFPWWSRALINLCCWCPWRGIPSLLSTPESLLNFWIPCKSSVWAKTLAIHFYFLTVDLLFFCQAKIDTVLQIFNNCLFVCLFLRNSHFTIKSLVSLTMNACQWYPFSLQIRRGLLSLACEQSCCSGSCVIVSQNWQVPE